MANEEHALTTWRKANNISQEELAVELGITRWMVTSIETGRRKPSWNLAKRISAFTDGKLTLEDFAKERESAA